MRTTLQDLSTEDFEKLIERVIDRRLQVDTGMKTRILNRIEWMGENAQLIRHQALHGYEWHGCFNFCLPSLRWFFQLQQALG